MNRSIAIGGIFFVVFCLLNCGKEHYNEALGKVAERFLRTDSVKYTQLIVIPATGCAGCISNAEYYFLQRVQNPEIKFVFTGIVSKKALTLRLKKEYLQQKNVYIDEDNLFYLTGFEEKIYPYKITLHNNKVLQIQRLD